MTTMAKTTHWFDFAGSKGALLSRHLRAVRMAPTSTEMEPQSHQNSAPSRAWLVPMGLIALFMLGTVIAM